MRKDILYKLLEIFMLFILSILSSSYNIFPFFISLILYKIFNLTISSISYKSTYLNNNSNSSVFKLLMFKLSGYTTLFIIISLILSKLFNFLYNINNLSIIFLLMVFNVFCDGGILIIKEYLNRKKIRRNIIDIYKILSCTLFIIISIILFKLVGTSKYLYLLYLPKIISYILILILFIMYGYKNDRCNDKIKLIINYNTLVPISIYLYIYLSIIILSIILKYNYGMNIDKITTKIDNIYFYDLFIISYLIEIINIILIKKNNFIDNLKQVVDINIYLTAVFSVISGLIIYMIYNRYDNILFIVFLIFIINIYKYIGNYKYHKNYLIFSIISGLIIKLMITYPLIISFNRMGYDIISGEIISNIISIFITIILLMGYIIKKENISLSKLTEFIINKINKGIIIAIFLIILSIFIPLVIEKRIYAPLIVLIYLIFSYIINMTLKKLFK